MLFRSPKNSAAAAVLPRASTNDMMTEHWENLNALTAPLLTWYDLNGRTLPWRSVVTPYRTWVSEIMLQQTRVGAVIPYFERFMEELPDVSALAAVSEERLLKLWEGLGYYSRARNLQRAARVIVSDFGGALPQSYHALLSLPVIISPSSSFVAFEACTTPISLPWQSTMILSHSASITSRSSPTKRIPTPFTFCSFNIS